MSKLGESTQILNALKSTLTTSDLIIAARNLINSNLDFGAEIYSLAADCELKRIQLQVQKMGRIVLKKLPMDHVSNFTIYSKLNIYPVRILTTIKTLAFWKKRLEGDGCDLKSEIERAFSTVRRSHFLPGRELILPLAKLTEKYDFYVAHCRATNKIFHKFNSPNFTKSHLDTVFSDYRSNKFEFETLSDQKKRGRGFFIHSSQKKRIKPSDLNFRTFLI